MSGGDRTARRAVVVGRVQGVGFRWAAREEARARGVHGWVRNLADGRVEAWCEGAPAAVAGFLAWLEQGPPAARVTAVHAAEVDPTGADGFDVRRGAP